MPTTSDKKHHHALPFSHQHCIQGLPGAHYMNSHLTSFHSDNASPNFQFTQLPKEKRNRITTGKQTGHHSHSPWIPSTKTSPYIISHPHTMPIHITSSTKPARNTHHKDMKCYITQTCPQVADHCKTDTCYDKTTPQIDFDRSDTESKLQYQ